MADLLIERTQQGSWVVVFKSLVSIHNLMNYGNERFTQYLASNNCSFNLSGFVDKGGVQGLSAFLSACLPMCLWQALTSYIQARLKNIHSVKKCFKILTHKTFTNLIRHAFAYKCI